MKWQMLFFFKMIYKCNCFKHEKNHRVPSLYSYLTLAFMAKKLFKFIIREFLTWFASLFDILLKTIAVIRRDLKIFLLYLLKCHWCLRNVFFYLSWLNTLTLNINKTVVLNLLFLQNTYQKKKKRKHKWYEFC